MSSDLLGCGVRPLSLMLALSVCSPIRAAVHAQDQTGVPLPSPTVQPESEEVKQARELTARARERFEAGDYAVALHEFARAYELMAHDPRRAALLNNIAVCHERLFRYDLALAYYQRYLEQADPSADDRAEVEAVIRGLRGLLGKLHLTSNVRAEVWVDGRLLGHAPSDVHVPAGTRVLELQARGYQPVRRTLQVAARSFDSVHLELEPLPTYRGIHRRYFWTGVALTGVALVIGAGLGLRALAEHEEAKDLKRQQLLRPGDQDHAQRLALAADVAFGAAALFAVSSAVLAFVTDFGPAERKPDVPPKADAPRMALRPRATPSTLELTLSGAFR